MSSYRVHQNQGENRWNWIRRPPETEQEVRDIRDPPRRAGTILACHREDFGESLQARQQLGGNPLSQGDRKVSA